MERDEQRRDEGAAGERPSDTEGLVGDTPLSAPLTDARRVQPPERESREGDAPEPGAGVPATRSANEVGDREADREAELGHS